VAAEDPVIRGLQDLSGLLSGDLRRAASLPQTLPQAVAAVRREISRKP
jgi:hypothetical protein